MEKEINAANLLGLSKCPFCPYACVIENEQERLFTCMREGCEVISCRQCKKVDHLPKTCAEADDDLKVTGLHKVEGTSSLEASQSVIADPTILLEAMSKALIRSCPKCSEPYIKEAGCNKIACPSCRTLSCFVSRSLSGDCDTTTEATTMTTIRFAAKSFQAMLISLGLVSMQVIKSRVLLALYGTILGLERLPKYVSSIRLYHERATDTSSRLKALESKRRNKSLEIIQL